MEKHFVTFLSPGTLFAESTTKEIESWDAKKATAMAREIIERHGATPYAFHFTTRQRSEAELDSKVVATSNTYYLGGVIETIADVKKRNSPDERILLSNMECNGYDKIIINTNSWKVTQPFREGDVLLAFKVEKR